MNVESFYSLHDGGRIARYVRTLAGSVFAAVFTLASAMAAATEPAPLRVVLDSNYPPYVMRNVEGDIEGLLVDEWRLWQKHTGRPVKLIAANWDEAQGIMQRGEADVIDTIFRTPERERLYDFSKPYATIPVSIYAHHSITGIHDTDNLQGFLIGVKAGDACIDRLSRAGLTKLQTYPNYQALVIGAQSAEVRIFCMDDPPALYLLHQAGANEDYRIAFSLFSGEFHRAVHKGNAALLAEVEQGFAAISPRERAVLNGAWLGKALPSPLNDNIFYGLVISLGLVMLFAAIALFLQHLVRQRTAELSAAKAQLEATLAAIPDLLFEVDHEGRYLSVSTLHAELLAAPIATLLGQTIAEILPPEATAICHAALAEASATGFSFGRTLLLDVPDGPRWFELSVSKKQGVEPRFIILSRDITTRVHAEQKLERMTQLYDALSQCNQAIVRCRNEEELFPIICRNAVAHGGFRMAWIGQIDTVQQRVTPAAKFGSGNEYLDTLVISTLASEPTGQGPIGRAIRANTPFWCQDFQHDPITAPWHERGKLYGWGSLATLPLMCKGVVVGSFNVYDSKPNAFDEAAQNLLIEMAMDISFALERFAHTRAHAEATLTIERMANFDALTGLPNRALLQDRAHQSFANASRSGQQVTVMFLDLDHFKNINDALGHAVGDQLLCAVSRRLQATVREQDTVARWGGDEFVLLLPDTTAAGATRIAEKLMASLSTPYRLEHHEMNSTSSVGIALYPSDGKDFETLAKAADTAMFRAKQEGRNAFRFFTAELEARSRRFLELENALRQALRRNEFLLYFQPQIALDGDRLIGAEALIRWQHPTLGMISPAEFIPVAEQSGQILDIGTWVMREAMRQTRAWQDAGLPPFTIAVNLSAAQFRQRHLLEQTSALLAETGLPSNCLELEITESLAMENPQVAVDIIDALHDQGITLSIDDFGTGYSSLAYLKRFRVNKLKIDQSFVRDIASDEDDRAIVATIISLAQHLGFTTIAEGVETQEQLDYLRLHGCEEVQGYFFSRPLPAVEFERFVRARNGA